MSFDGDNRPGIMSPERPWFNRYDALLTQFGQYREALAVAEARIEKLEKRNTKMAEYIEELETKLQGNEL